VQYEKLVSYWIGEKYTLRYTGGMVPDVFQVGLDHTDEAVNMGAAKHAANSWSCYSYAQIIVKEKGVFSNVTSPSTKAKLRILFEVAPLGLLVRALSGLQTVALAALHSCLSHKPVPAALGPFARL
jgi:sedoheptulose-bisphosphatase